MALGGIRPFGIAAPLPRAVVARRVDGVAALHPQRPRGRRRAPPPAAAGPRLGRPTPSTWSAGRVRTTTAPARASAASMVCGSSAMPTWPSPDSWVPRNTRSPGSTSAASTGVVTAKSSAWLPGSAMPGAAVDRLHQRAAVPRLRAGGPGRVGLPERVHRRGDRGQGLGRAAPAATSGWPGSCAAPRCAPPALAPDRHQAARAARPPGRSSAAAGGGGDARPRPAARRRPASSPPSAR